MNTFLDLGVRIVVAIQGLGGWLEVPMKVMSFLGTEDFFIFILPVLYWCVDSSLGIRVAFILMFSQGIKITLKLAFHDPRPYWYSPAVKYDAVETSFGIPSGHSMEAMSVWGMMAAKLKKWWGWLVAGLVIFLIGFSRLYLGVHFPQDVLLGWLLGGLLLWLTIRFWTPIANWLKNLPISGQYFAAFIFSLVIILLPLLPYIFLRVSGWQPDPAWASYAGGALNLEEAFTAAGTTFGMGAGLALMTHKGGFKTSGKWWQLVLRFLIGIAGALIIRYGLKFIFPEGENILAYCLRYLRYALIGFWVAAGAPWTFLRLKLAQQ